MRKKLIVTNTIIVSFSLVVMTLISIFIVYKDNYNSSAEQVKKYLDLASFIYDGSNSEELITEFKETDSNIRITIMDLEGNVIADSNKSNINNSHIDRTEIQNLNNIYTRYSETLQCDMMYIADIDDNNYIRIAIPIASINDITLKFVSINLIILIVLLSISISLILILSKRSLNPVNQEISILANLADNHDFIDTSIDDLPLIIEEIRNSLNEKINKISNQKRQINDVLNKMNSGVLVINNKKELTLINEKALDVFKMSYDNVIKKEYVYLIRNNDLQDLIEESLINRNDNEITIEINNSYYTIIISYADLSWINNGLIITLRDITQMVELDKMKREFFANASHELKSPLTCIIGYQQLITEGIEDDSEAILNYSRLTLKEAKRMNDIVIDMLNLSRLERKESIANEKINVKCILVDILESLKQKIELSNLKVNLDIDDVILDIDKNLVYQLFRNLIDNSIKYNKPNGFINISLNKNQFSVEDSGIGIPFNEQTRVFERFYRVDKAKSKALGGTGLGLAIVKHICEVYGFSISLKSIFGDGCKVEILFNNKK